MVEIADFLDDDERDDLLSFESFLDSRDINDTEYAIFPKGSKKSNAPFTIEYFRNNDGISWSLMRFPMGKGFAEIEQEMGNAGWFLCFLLTSDWINESKEWSLDSSAEDVFGAFGLDAKKYLRPSLGAKAEGSYIAPDKGGFVDFHIGEEGEFLISARSKSIVPLALRLATEEHVLETDFLEQLGEHYPGSDDDEDMGEDGDEDTGSDDDEGSNDKDDWH